LNSSDVQDLYTKSIDRYASFISAFQSPLAVQALLRRSNLVREGLRVLDAGCGFGMVTFSLLKVLRQKNLV
jgi:ubiquinone/menaquinone biosynthesis C-methylase UbiE